MPLKFTCSKHTIFSVVHLAFVTDFSLIYCICFLIVLRYNASIFIFVSNFLHLPDIQPMSELSPSIKFRRFHSITFLWKYFLDLIFWMVLRVICVWIFWKKKKNYAGFDYSKTVENNLNSDAEEETEEGTFIIFTLLIGSYKSFVP